MCEHMIVSTVGSSELQCVQQFWQLAHREHGARSSWHCSLFTPLKRVNSSQLTTVCTQCTHSAHSAQLLAEGGLGAGSSCCLAESAAAAASALLLLHCTTQLYAYISLNLTSIPTAPRIKLGSNQTETFGYTLVKFETTASDATRHIFDFL